MKKTFKYYAVAWAVLLAAYNVIVFAVQPIMGFTKNYDGRFWLAWGFTIAAFVGQLVCAAVAFKAENKEKLFLNIPLITESYTALIVMTVAGAVLMLIPGCPAWVATVVCVIIFAISAVSVLKAQAAAELVSNIDEKVTSFIRTLAADAESLLARAQTPEIKAEVKKVYEAIRYSDPMSREALNSMERQIEEQFTAFSRAVRANEADVVRATAAELTALVSERNHKCKLLK